MACFFVSRVLLGCGLLLDMPLDSLVDGIAAIASVPGRLERVGETEEFCVFQHEDMFLYNRPDSEKLDEAFSILSADNSDLDFIRLIKSGETIITEINHLN